MLFGLEADDVIGLLATGKYADRHVVVSTDKDMQTLPCALFNPNKDVRPRRVRQVQADIFWMTQTLTGDTTDGYPGCPGVGPKKAAAALAEASPNMASLWETVVRTYDERGRTEEDALVQARLARILRHGDFDKQNMEVKLWHPTHPTTIPLAETLPAPSGDPF